MKPVLPLCLALLLLFALSRLAMADVAVPMTPVQVQLFAPDTPAIIANPPVQTINSVTVATPVATGCQNAPSGSDMLDWLDQQHCLLSRQTGAAAGWLDHFFGDAAAEQASLLVRVITQEQCDSKTGNQLTSNILASIRLPNADRRLRLVISDDRDDLLGGTKNISPEQLRLQSASSTAALSFLSLMDSNLRVNTDVGLRSGPDAFVRARARDAWSLSPNTSIRGSQTLRYAVEDEGRSITDLNLERLLAATDVMSFSNEFSYWEKEDHQLGMRWNQGVALTHNLGVQEFLAGGLGTEGVTRPVWARESYGVWLLWRHAVWKDWVFTELEPRLTRYRQYNWDLVPSITLRLELQFGHK